MHQYDELLAEQSSQTALVERAIDADEAAFHALYERHGLRAVHGGPLQRRGRRMECGVYGVPWRVQVSGVRVRRGDHEERVRRRHVLDHRHRDDVHGLPERLLDPA